jgi:Recombinase zinc beta ribbon domain
MDSIDLRCAVVHGAGTTCGAAGFPERLDTKYLLASRIRCPGCGERMGGNRNQAQCRAGYVAQPRYVCAGPAKGRGGKSRRCHQSALGPAVDETVVARVSSALAAAGERAPERVLIETNASRVPRHSATARLSVDARARRLNLVLQLLDGKITETKYRRRRLRLPPEDSCDLRGVGRSARASRELDLDRAAIVSEEWGRAVALNDTTSVRRIVLELIESVTPIRRARGHFDVQINWTPFARQSIGVDA